MNYSKINDMDSANGPGLRVSLFVSGCSHHCKGCFNPETWDYEFGEVYNEETEKEIITLLNSKYKAGLTLLGGDPLEIKNQNNLIPLLKELKSKYPKQTIWCYTGYSFENLLKRSTEDKEILKYLDVIVDGEFIEELKDLKLRFKGSSNQRIINVQESISTNLVKIWE